MSNYPAFNIIGDEQSVPVANIGDNRVTQGIGFPLAPISQQGGDTQYTGPASILTAESFANQIPPDPQGTPLQVEFGAPQSNADVTIDAVGNITLLNAAVYGIVASFNVMRVANNGFALFLIRGLVNGVQGGNPVAVYLDDGNNTHYQQLSITGSLPAGSVLTFEVARDPSEFDDGELESYASTIGWGSTPSAIIRIIKY